MPFCSNCGSQVEGQLCPKCGAAIADPGVSGSQPVSGAPGLSINAASALCYLFGLITGIVFLVLAPYSQNRRVRFHAFQSIFLNVQVGITVVSLMFHAVTFSLSLLVGSLHLLVSLAFFLVWLYMMWNTYQGGDTRLPLIGDMAASQAGTGVTPPGTIGRAA